MRIMVRAGLGGVPPAPDDDEAAEDSPLLLGVSRALQALLRKAASLHHLTETASEVDTFCGAIEAVLLHRFKARQFYMFTCHPWSLIEATESWGDLEAEGVRLAREVGTSDVARLRAWLFVQLNQRSLQLALGAVLDDDNLRTTFFHERALMQRAECRQLLIDLLRPLGGLSFRLGAAAGLAAVAVVADPALVPNAPRNADAASASSGTEGASHAATMSSAMTKTESAPSSSEVEAPALIAVETTALAGSEAPAPTMTQSAVPPSIGASVAADAAPSRSASMAAMDANSAHDKEDPYGEDASTGAASSSTEGTAGGAGSADGSGASLATSSSSAMLNAPPPAGSSAPPSPLQPGALWPGFSVAGTDSPPQPISSGELPAAVDASCCPTTPDVAGRSCTAASSDTAAAVSKPEQTPVSSPSDRSCCARSTLQSSTTVRSSTSNGGGAALSSASVGEKDVWHAAITAHTPPPPRKIVAAAQKRAVPAIISAPASPACAAGAAQGACAAAAPAVDPCIAAIIAAAGTQNAPLAPPTWPPAKAATASSTVANSLGAAAAAAFTAAASTLSASSPASKVPPPPPVPPATLPPMVSAEAEFPTSQRRLDLDGLNETGGSIPFSVCGDSSSSSPLGARLDSSLSEGCEHSSASGGQMDQGVIGIARGSTEASSLPPASLPANSSSCCSSFSNSVSSSLSGPRPSAERGTASRMLTWSEGYERAASEPEPVLWQQPTAATLKPPESTLEAPKTAAARPAANAFAAPAAATAAVILTAAGAVAVEGASAPVAATAGAAMTASSGAPIAAAPLAIPAAPLAGDGGDRVGSVSVSSNASECYCSATSEICDDDCHAAAAAAAAASGYADLGACSRAHLDHGARRDEFAFSDTSYEGSDAGSAAACVPSSREDSSVPSSMPPAPAPVAFHMPSPLTAPATSGREIPAAGAGLSAPTPPSGPPQGAETDAHDSRPEDTSDGLLSGIVFDYFASNLAMPTSGYSSAVSSTFGRAQGASPILAEPTTPVLAPSSPGSRLAVRSVHLVRAERREAGPRAGQAGGGSPGSSPSSSPAESRRGSINGRPRGFSIGSLLDGAAASAAVASAASSVTARRRRAHTVYQLRARVGPFECTSARRFSDFLNLHERLLHAAAKGRKAGADGRHVATSWTPLAHPIAAFPHVFSSSCTQRTCSSTCILTSSPYALSPRDGSSLSRLSIGRQALVAATPTARKLRESKLAFLPALGHKKLVEQRMKVSSANVKPLSTYLHMPSRFHTLRRQAVCALCFTSHSLSRSLFRTLLRSLARPLVLCLVPCRRCTAAC